MKVWSRMVHLLATALSLSDAQAVRVRDFLRVSLMKEHQPGTRNFVVLDPLSNAPFRELGNFHYLGSATHCFDNLACIHDA